MKSLSKYTSQKLNIIFHKVHLKLVFIFFNKCNETTRKFVDKRQEFY